MRPTDRPTVGSLFSGIGGFELGFEWAGFEVAWQCEADEFCRRVLAKHWPNVPKYTDVRRLAYAGSEERICGPGLCAHESTEQRRRRLGDLHGKDYAQRVDVLIGGFPCQDVSDAGKRAGLEGARSGLWFEFDRCVGDFRPRIVVIENVRGLLVRGADVVLGCLARRGYDAEWALVRASDVGAPHRRARLFIIAYRMDDADAPEWRPRASAGTVTDGNDTRWQETSGRSESPSSQRLADAADPIRRADRRSVGTREGSGRSETPKRRLREGLRDAFNDGLTEGGNLDDAEANRSTRWVLGQPEGAVGSQIEAEFISADARDRVKQRLADAHQGGLGEPNGSWNVDRCGARSVADADGDGRRGLRGQAGRGSNEPEQRQDTDRSSQGFGGVENAEHARLEGAQRAIVEGSNERRHDADRSTRWPARPGEPQHDWEPPRVIPSARAESTLGSLPDGISGGLPGWRRAALGALGNAIVPQVAEVVAWRVRQILERGTADA